MTASSLDEPTFADCAFFYDRSQDRASYSGQSGDQLEGQSWRAGQGAGASPVGVHSEPRVSYYFPKGVGEYHFGERHPMKPHRLTLTNHLVIGYGLHKKMDLYQPRSATRDELETFHDHDYVDFLSRVTPNNVREFSNVLSKFNFGDDCPIFSDMWDYCRQYAGASLMAARKLISGTTDIAINWTGGLHHAKKAEASGFCYVNDIVLAILELLRVHARVLYIDIDIHHGDGVQEAFYNSNRVMTVSFHKYSHDFFPSTGHLDEVGHSLGKYFSLNIPLQDGIDNESYVALFKSVMEPTINTFQPSSIVLQCGADSLGCDRLGCFNLSIAAHGECVRFIKSFGLPLIVLGGGGYTIKNVARCWTYETAVLLDLQQTLPNKLPHTPYDDFFGPDFKLHPDLMAGRHRIENLNTRKELERIRIGCLERLRYMHGAPSVQMQEVPPGLSPWMLDEAEANKMDAEANADSRNDDHKANGDFFDGDRDNDQNQDDLLDPQPKLAVAPAASAPASAPAPAPAPLSGPGAPGRIQLPNFVRTKPRITGGPSAVPSGATATAAGAAGAKKKKKALVAGRSPIVVGTALGGGAVRPTAVGPASGPNAGGGRPRPTGSSAGTAGAAPPAVGDEAHPMDQSA